jgi:hypothetical protein
VIPLPVESRAEERVDSGTDSVARGHASRARTIAYWTFTLLVAFEMVAGSLWDLLQIEFTRVSMAHLGYPPYFPYITGVWKLPCAMALVAPRFQRVKEWAYAGAFFTYFGAVASHVFVGDRTGKWVPPLALAIFTIASWALRPPERRLPRVERTPVDGDLAPWIVPSAIIAALFVVALLTLPKGPPPP